jgi:glycosidase
LARLKHLAAIRASAPAFADDRPVDPIAVASPSLLSFVRGRGGERIQVVANFSDQTVRAPLEVAGAQGWRDLASGEFATGQTVELPPYGLVWAQGL